MRLLSITSWMAYHLASVWTMLIDGINLNICKEDIFQATSHNTARTCLVGCGKRLVDVRQLLQLKELLVVHGAGGLHAAVGRQQAFLEPARPALHAAQFQDAAPDLISIDPVKCKDESLIMSLGFPCRAGPSLYVNLGC